MARSGSGNVTLQKGTRRLQEILAFVTPLIAVYAITCDYGYWRVIDISIYQMLSVTDHINSSVALLGTWINIGLALLLTVILFLLAPIRFIVSKLPIAAHPRRSGAAMLLLGSLVVWAAGKYFPDSSDHIGNFISIAISAPLLFGGAYLVHVGGNHSNASLLLVFVAITGLTAFEAGQFAAIDDTALSNRLTVPATPHLIEIADDKTGSATICGILLRSISEGVVVLELRTTPPPSRVVRIIPWTEIKSIEVDFTGLRTINLSNWSRK